MEWIVFWLLCLASVHVAKTAAVDAWVQITDPTREPPSLAARRIRAELARQQAATTGAPGVGQAAADRLASWIAHPPPRPAWITEALSYLALLLSDALASARRRHAAAQRDREDESRSGEPGSPYCWRCDITHVASPGDLCSTCTPVVKAPCPGCGTFVPLAELDDGPCGVCRIRAAATDTPGPDQRPGPARLVIPWLSGAENSTSDSGRGPHYHRGGTP